MAVSEKKSVLFICLGNICRSPIAEAVFLNLLTTHGKNAEWDVDSAAIGDWHIGRSPDSRAMATLKKHNISDYKHKVRLVTREDFDKFDYIFGMDHQNISDLDDIKPSKCKAQLKLLGEYDPQKELIIKDPYYEDGMKPFEEVFEQCVRCCSSFLEKC